MKVFSEEQLKTFDGRNGQPAYVAYNGKVYDVTGSGLWRNGIHVKHHKAGRDLSRELETAPHDDQVFAGRQVVGRLVPQHEKGSESVPFWAKIVLGLHSHPISVHFPQAFLVFSPLFLAAFYLFREPTFDSTAFYLQVCGLALAIPTYLTGLVHWRYKFVKPNRGIFRFKIVAPLFLIALATWTSYSHYARLPLHPEEIDWLLCASYCAQIPLISSIGHAGGKIAFG